MRWTELLPRPVRRRAGRRRRKRLKNSAHGLNPGLVVKNGCALKVAPEEGSPTGIRVQLETSLLTHRRRNARRSRPFTWFRLISYGEPVPMKRGGLRRELELKLRSYLPPERQDLCRGHFAYHYFGHHSHCRCPTRRMPPLGLSSKPLLRQTTSGRDYEQRRYSYELPCEGATPADRAE
jgi:hypothetical protein